MKKFLQKTKDLKALGAVLFIMLLFSTVGWGQQVIGQFPTMDGGFEAQTGTLVSGSITTNTQKTAWTHGATSTVVNATGGRSGSKYITSSYTSTTSTSTYTSSGHVRVQSPTTAQNAILASTTSPAVSNTYMVQFYYKLATGGATTGTIRAGVSPDGTVQSNYNNPTSTNLTNVSNTGWLKYSIPVVTKTGTQSYGIGIIDYFATTASTTVSYDFDDFVVYAGSTTDSTPPDTPTTAVAGVDNSIAAQLTVNWTAPSTGVDGGGYVVVRYASAPFAENDPNANGIYSIGNTFSSGVTNTLTGKVVYVGTGTSFIDSGLAASSTYYYKVYAVDKAFNYSTELTPSAGVTYISGTTSAVGNSSTTYYFVPTSGTNVNSLSNWFPNADGTGTNPIDFSAVSTTFNMYNNGTTTTSWALGSGSKIVVGNGTVATTLTIASGSPLTGGAVDVSAGSKLIIAGGVAPTFGTLNLTSTVEITVGTTTQIPATTFGNLTVSGAGTVVTQTASIVINGDFTIIGGAFHKFDNSVTGRNITIGGNFVSSGSGGIDAVNGSQTNQIYFNGAGKSINNTATGNNFYKSSLNINGTYSLGADFKFITNLNSRVVNIAAAGSLNLNGYKFSLDNNAAIPIVITAGGQLIANGAGSTVEFFGNTTIQSIPTSVNYNNLIITGGAKGIDAGTLSVAGNLTVNTGATFNGATNNPTVNIGGAFNNIGTFTQGNGTVTFNGGSAQTFANTGTCAFNNLTLNNSTGLTISNNLTVNGALTFTSGNITTGANAVVLGAAGSVARTSGHVAGNFTKNLTTSTTSVNYEIGGGSTYRPVALVFGVGAITNAGTLTASVSQTAGAHPQLATSLLDPNKRVNNYFTLSSSALAFSTAAATFNFVAGDVVGGADTNNFIVQKYASSSWSSATVGAKTSTTTEVTGIASFGDFAIGEASPIPLLTNSALASFGNVCVNTSSSANSFTITGANLTADDVTVGPAAGYTFSTNNVDYTSSLSLTQAGGSYSQLVYVKFNPTTIQSNVSIPVAGGGAASISVATIAVGVNTAVAVSAGSASVLPTSATVSSTYTAGCSSVLAYGVEYSTTSGFSNGSGTQVAGSGGASFTAAISSLSPNTTYYYKTYATDGTGTIYSSTQSSFITANLNAPVAAAATAITSSGFTANWSAVTGATNYLLNVYTAATENIVGWTFPLIGTTVTPDIVSTNNSTNTLTVSSTIADAVGVTNRAALTTTWGTVGKYWEVSVNTTGYRAIKVSSAQQSSSSGPKDFKLQYRIGDNTGAFSDVLNGSIIVPNGTYAALDNVLLPDACNNQSVVYLRWTTTSTLRADQTTTPGATIASGGTNRIDNIIITGGKMSYLTGYNPKTVTSATTYDVTGAALGSTYYYDVRANATTSTSAVSNAISLTILADETVADYRSKQSGDFSSVSTWEFNDATQWLTATTTPTSANNITIVSGHEVTLTAPISVASTKAITVNGTINLAGKVVSGLGSFVLSTAASIKLGNNASLATAITTSTTTLNAAANYFYDGTTLQNTTSLPATVTGNITVSNNTGGVMMASSVKINSPGTLFVTGKLFFGDGNVSGGSAIGAGTFTYSGSGHFSAAAGSTLSITSSKGICTGTASGCIKNSGTRTFANGINYIFAKNDLINAINMGTSFGTEISTTLGINNLTIANPLGVYLPGAIQAVNAGGTSVTDFVPDTDITVNGVLNFVSGALVANNGANLTTTVNGVTTYSAVPQSTGTKTVTVVGSDSITGAGASTGWVIGNLKKLTNSGASPSFTYTIGDATYYTPLAVTFTGNTSANGGLTARTTAGDHAQISSSDILPNKSINRTWTLTNASLADFTDYSATFTYATDDNDSNAVLTYFGSRLYNGTSWTSLTTSGTPTSTSLTATSITGFGDFAIGQICNNPTSGGTISGTQSFCGIGNPADLMSASSATGFTGVLEYQWQKSTDNVNFTDVTDATAINYSPTAGLSVTTYYRRLARVDCKSSWTGAASSNVITVTVTPVVTPTFTQVAPICLGTTLSALPTTSNNGVTGSWSPSINSAATTLYTFTPSSDVCADSATMSITVNQSVAGTISGNQTITTGTTPTSISLSNYTGNIQWQSSTNGTSFSNINGATSATLSGATIGALTVNTYIRAVVTNGSCASVNSAVSTITITCCKFKFSSN